MEFLLSETSGVFSWLVNNTKDVSVLICIIFIIKFIAAKRFPVWWSYSLWLLLLFRMIIPLELIKNLHNSSFVPVSIDYHTLGSNILNKEVLMCGTAKESSPYLQVLGLPIDDLFIFIWIAGAVFFGMFILNKNIRFWSMLKQMPVLKDKRVTDLLDVCKARMNIRKEVDIIITDNIRNPAIFGYLHPRLILPQGICEKFTDEELTYVFMHEMGHLKRHDIAVSWIMALLQTIYWFNPLVWFAFYQMRLDQEIACDESVLSRSRNYKSVHYANVIISFLEKYSQNKSLASMSYIFENKAQIKRRLAMIVNYRRYSKRMTVTAFAILITIGAVFCGFNGFVKASQNNSDWDPATQDAVEEALNAIQDRKYSDAEKILTDYLRGTPNVIPKVLYETLGEVYSVQKKYDHAINILEQGYREYPEDDRINEMIISCNARKLYEDNQFYEAGRLHEKIYEDYPGNRFRLAMAVDSYFRAGEIEEANRIYKSMVDMLNDNDVVWLEALIQTSEMLGLKEESDIYRDRLKATGIYSNMLLSNETETEQRDIRDYYRGGKIFSLTDVDVLPRVIKQIKPRYPAAAEKNKISGKVTLRFIVTKEGCIRDASVIESEPKGVFDGSALEAIRQYRFRPGVKGGESVDVVVTAPISYNVVGAPVKEKTVREASVMPKDRIQ